jgi:two-component system response regulator AtoC
MNNILIIDDQKLIRSSLKVALEKEAYAVCLARTGAEGLGIIREHDVDLVLLDIMLPDINGIEVLKKIKEIDADIIVIMMTGYGTIESAVQAMKYDAFDYISKPFKAETIQTILKFALGPIRSSGRAKPCMKSLKRSERYRRSIPPRF